MRFDPCACTSDCRDCSTATSRGRSRARLARAGRLVTIAGRLALVCASGPAYAAGPSGPVGAAAEPEASADVLRVEVEPGIDDAALLPGWIAGRHPDLRDDLPALEAAHAQWIAVRIAGSTYDYRVSVTVVRDGEPVGPPAEPSRCECTTEELLEHVDAGIDAALAGLPAAAPSEPAPPAAVVPAAAPTSRPEPGPPEPSPVLAKRDGSSRRLGSLGRAGVGMTVAGAGLVAAGIALAVQPKQIRGEPGDAEIRDFRGGGIGAAVSGGVVLATGVALLVVDRVAVRRRATVWLPVLRPGMAGVSIVRRF